MVVVRGHFAPTSRCMEKAVIPPNPVAQNTTFSCLVVSVCCHLKPGWFSKQIYTLIGNSVTSEACYSNALLPITRLKNALITTFSEYDIGTPTENGTCHLTATRNVFGRLVSGIDASDVCVNSGTVRRVIPCTCLQSRGCMGKFVHVEQDPDLLLPTNYGRWADAFNAVFPSSPLRMAEEVEANVFRVQSYVLAIPNV